MVKFERQVKRQKTNFQFTKKEEANKTNHIQRTLSFYWIPRKWTSLFIVLLNFIFVTIVAIPLLMLRFNIEVSLLLGHGLITSLLIVMSFYHMENKSQKSSLKELILRFLLMAVLLLVFAMIAIWVL